MTKYLDWNDVGSIVRSTVTHYVSDLVHDGAMFAQHVGKEFVWELRSTGTHLALTTSQDMMRYFRTCTEPGRRYFLIKVDAIDPCLRVTAREIERHNIGLPA